jgi:hypothetical protein
MAGLKPEPAPGVDPFPAGADAFPDAPEGRRAGKGVKTPEIGSQTAEKMKGQEPTEMLIPWIGERVDLGDPKQVAQALDTCRSYKRDVIQPMINALERVVAGMVESVGSATIRAGEWEMVAPAKRKYTRDLEAIRKGLLEAGCPKERVDEVIPITISLSANTGDLDRLSKANKEYAAIIDEHTTVEEQERSVSVKRAKDAGA